MLNETEDETISIPPSLRYQFSSGAQPRDWHAVGAQLIFVDHMISLIYEI